MTVILAFRIARSILDSKDKQITRYELTDLLEHLNTEQNQDRINRLLSNIFMKRRLIIKFESTLMQSYFEYNLKHSEDQTEE